MLCLGNWKGKKIVDRDQQTRSIGSDAHVFPLFIQSVAGEAYPQVSLSHVVLLGTTMYLRALVLILQNASSQNRCVNENGVSEPLIIDQCVDWCDGRTFPGRNENNGTEVAAPLPRLFEFFAERFRVTDNSTVANHLLEILSILAFQDKPTLLKKLVELNWISLHTIYVHTGAGASEHGCCPFALAEATRRFGLAATSSEQLSLRRVVDRTVHKLCHHGQNKIHGIEKLRQGMLRHWGLEISTTGHSAQERNQLSKMNVTSTCKDINDHQRGSFDWK